SLDLTLGEFRLTGRLTGLTPDGWVGYRLASMKANDYLNLWLHHLASNAVAPVGAGSCSHWVAEDQEVVLEPVANPHETLRALLELYWRGTRRLLHFFPRSALAYVEKLGKDGDGERALRAAQTEWAGSEYRQGRPEREDGYYRLAFRDTDPLDGEFVELATAVFEPLFAHVRREAED
ncbi:MAG TPA: exodeoxyribonuclease V subunit gamma, partial [Candidatus Competibacter phosphatis]|nr:exodeoxyribonuclease V subunit gamma [Candidatus Competibacter phosphatis]